MACRGEPLLDDIHIAQPKERGGDGDNRGGKRHAARAEMAAAQREQAEEKERPGEGEETAARLRQQRRANTGDDTGERQQQLPVARPGAQAARGNQRQQHGDIAELDGVQIAGGASGGQQLRREMAVIPRRRQTEQRAAGRPRPNGAPLRRYGGEKIKQQRYGKKLQRRFQAACTDARADDIQQGNASGEEKAERQPAQRRIMRSARPPVRQRDEGGEQQQRHAVAVAAFNGEA